MSWTRTDPGAGDPWGIRHQASIRQTGADQLRTTTLTNVQTAVTDASSASWTAKAATAFASTAQGLIPEVQVIITGLETDAGALNQYAAMVEQIRDQALALKSQQEAAQADLSRAVQATFTMPDAPSGSLLLTDPDAQDRARLTESIAATRSTLTQVEVRWDELARQRQAADDTCLGTLTSVGSRGNLAGLGMAQLGSLSSTDLLQTLGGLSVTEITILLQNHPELAEEFRTNPPDAAGVQTWWSGLDTASQDALISELPIVIGNLEGVPYATRVEANKLNIDTGIVALEEDLAILEKAAATRPPGVAGYGSFEPGPEILKKIDAVQEQIDYYEDLRDEKVTFVDPATGKPVTVTGHNILVFDHANDAIAEYSGVLDPVTGNVPAGVENLGIYVPGTGSTLANFGGQVERSEWLVKREGGTGTVAMITWKGGAFPQGGEAISGGLADRLGQKLAGFGEGLELATSANVTGLGYSAGGSVLGAAERAGLAVDRVLHVASAGMGHGVRDLDQYPASADVPHYSLMAPKDPLGLSQSLEAGDWGHGGSPLTTEGFTRLETGYLVSGTASSGQIEGHSDIWNKKGTTLEQMYGVIAGEQVELYAEPELIYTDPSSGHSVYSNPIMEPGYKPEIVDVQGGEQ